jgi:hypothetical protein
MKDFEGLTTSYPHAPTTEEVLKPWMKYDVAPWEPPYEWLVSQALAEAKANKETPNEETPNEEEATEVLHEVPLSLIQPPVAVRPHSDSDE